MAQNSGRSKNGSFEDGFLHCGTDYRCALFDLMKEIPAYPDGSDMAWLALDRDGFIGQFTTGGQGPVPRLALVEAELHVALWELIETRAPFHEAALNERYTVSATFRFCAAHGVFAYD